METKCQLTLAWICELYMRGQALARQHASGPLRQALLEHIVSGFEATSGSFALIDPNSNEFVIAAATYLPDAIIGKVVSRDSIMGYAAKARKPLLLNGDLREDPRYAHLVPPDRQVQPQSSLCWPLIAEDDIYGIVNINRIETLPAFNEADCVNGEQLMQQVALVIRNVQMHADNRDEIKQLKDYNAEIRQLNEALDLTKRELEKDRQEQRNLIAKLQSAQDQLMQSDKMASIGILAAGVAHEINNPIGFVNSNLGTLSRYTKDLLSLIKLYSPLEAQVAATSPELAEVKALKQRLDIGFLEEDLPLLLTESLEGIERVKKIVQDLKDFSHVDKADWQWTNLHAGLDSTLNIAHNEIKYKATVTKHYGELPEIECIASQVNQVFLNILVNAAQAMDEHGTIAVTTSVEGEMVCVKIADTGKGIPPDILSKIFDPFFTTKPVGKGTGLGLSLSYSIIEKHGGRIEVDSEIGKGTTFRVYLPVQQREHKAA